MTLYEIDAAILDCIDAETGEIADPERLDQLEMERKTKLQNIGLFYMNKKSEAEELAAEIKRLSERKHKAERTMESLKNYMAYALRGEKFKTPLVSVSYRTSRAVIVDDVNALPDGYRRITVDADKTAIKEAIESGEEITGAHMEERKSTVIR